MHHVVYMIKMKKSYSILLGNCKRKNLMGAGCMHRVKVNVKVAGRVIVCEGMDHIELAQNTLQ